MRLDDLARILHSRQAHEHGLTLLRISRAQREQPSPLQAALLRQVASLRRAKRHGFGGQRAGAGHYKLWNRALPVNRVPAALLNALAAAITVVEADGKKTAWIDREKLRALFGSEGIAVIDGLRRTVGRERPDLDGVNQWTLFSGLDDRVAEALVDPNQLLPRMPGFEWAVGRYGSLPRRIKGVLARWPGRSNTLALVKQVTDAGVSGENFVLWMDKRHFLDPRFAIGARLMGATPRGHSVDRDLAFIEAWIERQVASLTASERLSTKPLFLVSGDGGLLVEQVARVLRQERFADVRHLFAGTEQTGSGSNRLRKLDETVGLPFGVPDVARCWVKTRSGSTAFAYAIMGQAEQAKRRLSRQGVALGKRAAVLGNGHMGLTLATLLRVQGYEVTLWDDDPAVRSALRPPAAIGHAGARLPAVRVASSKIDAIRDADLVFTTTAGSQALGKRTLAALVRAGVSPRPQVWINGGSPGEIAKLRGGSRKAEIQTDRRGFLSGLFDGKRVVLGQKSAGPDRDRLFRYKGWQILSLRDGNVINGRTDLTGVQASVLPGRILYGYNARPDLSRNDPVPPQAIQLEIGLLHLAHLQALEGSSKNGLVELWPDPQGELLQKVLTSGNHAIVLGERSVNRAAGRVTLHGPLLW